MDLSVGKLERTSDDLCSVSVWKKDGVAVGNNNNKVNWPGLAQVSFPGGTLAAGVRAPKKIDSTAAVKLPLILSLSGTSVGVVTDSRGTDLTFSALTIPLESFSKFSCVLF